MNNGWDDEIPNKNYVAKSPSMACINLHGHRLKFLAPQVDHLLVLIIPF
jgi:hypothetical protein